MTDKSILDLCKEGIDAWQKAFNNQDAAGCADQYTEHCIMEAAPLGTLQVEKKFLNAGKTSSIKVLLMLLIRI